MLTFLASSILITINWLTYIWAVNTDHIVDTSLGYFINPLFSVFLGVVLLGERPLFNQMVALVFATLGVLYLTILYGSFPWISLTLALSFGLYGLIKKLGRLSALEGLSLEVLLLSVPAIIILLYLEFVGQGSFGHAPLRINMLLITSGIITAVPLLLFAHGARRITLTNLGLLQYIAPVCQFLIGILIYNEQVSSSRLIGFGLVWVGLLIFSADGIMRSRKTARSWQLKNTLP